VRNAARHRKPALRLALLLGVAVVASAVALTLRATEWLYSLELDTVDARFSVRGDRDPPRDMVIVAVDDRSLRELGPLAEVPLTVHAEVLDRLRRADSRLIAYDMEFQRRRGPRQERALLEAISRARPVLLATHAGAGPIPVGVRDPGRLGAHLGSIELLSDEDGLVRSLPYFYEPPQAFAVVGAGLARGEPVDDSKFDDGAAWIDFRGPPATFREVSLSSLVRGDVPERVFTDAIVLVGATSPSLKDVFPTPISADPMPGVEIHANSIATILDGLPLQEAAGGVEVALALGLALFAPLVAVRLSGLIAFAGGVLAAIAFLVVAQLAFQGGTILPVTYPLAGVVAGTAGAVMVDLMLETRNRRRMRQTFSRFVPEQVVADVLARTDDDLRLGGETLEATVLFCDLRRFSSFAERHSAATVIESLNRYLTEMSDAILEHGGTVVSYMGDGLMAVFGAPVEQADNAERAYAAAREMLEVRLPAFNEWLRERGYGEGFRVGIGLCTGPVTSGNVGSARRVEYAAVGDTTNVAARLQQMNKRFGSQLLMAESTRVRLRVPEAELVDAGEHSLAGRTGTLRVWGIASPPEAAPQRAETAGVAQS
jgi:adenylate cyclase